MKSGYPEKSLETLSQTLAKKKHRNNLDGIPQQDKKRDT